LSAASASAFIFFVTRCFLGGGGLPAPLADAGEGAPPAEAAGESAGKARGVGIEDGFVYGEGGGRFVFE
jgi:hypothetical protein